MTYLSTDHIDAAQTNSTRGDLLEDLSSSHPTLFATGHPCHAKARVDYRRFLAPHVLVPMQTTNLEHEPPSLVCQIFQQHTLRAVRPALMQTIDVHCTLTSTVI